MKSRWAYLKQEALSMRRQGVSMTVVERNLGIPRSTLSGWFKNVPLTEEQRTRLMKNSFDGWKKGRKKAVVWHNTQKAMRLEAADQAAQKTLAKIQITNEVLDLAFAMLYLGEGAKSGTTSMASSDPRILKFTLAVLRRNYSVTTKMIRCDLHLRMDQDEEQLKKYWSEQLSLPISCFRYAAFDKRSEGKTTYDHYKGVCVISCGQIAIQRKLMYLYNLFCDRVIEMEMGA